MVAELTRMELKKIVRYLGKVYPGVSDQDDLWDLIAKLNKLIEGDKHDKKTKTNQGK